MVTMPDLPMMLAALNRLPLQCEKLPKPRNRADQSFGEASSRSYAHDGLHCSTSATIEPRFLVVRQARPHFRQHSVEDV